MKKSAGIFFTDGESVLLMKRKDKKNFNGFWDLPGGKSIEGETELENAQRETKEETGLEEIPGVLINFLKTKEDNREYTCYFYKVENKFKVIISNEHSKYDWIKFEELQEKKIHPKLQKNLVFYLKKILKNTKKFSEWQNIRQHV